MDNGSSNKSAVAGGVIGSLVGLALVVGAVVYIRRRRRAETTPPLAHDSHGQDPPSEVLWTLLSPCNNFLNLLTAKRRITVPTNMLVTTLTHSTTLMIPKRGPKTLGSVNLLFTGRLLVRDNSPTAHPSLGNTLVPLSCRVDGMCDWIKLFTCRGDRRTLSYLSTYPIVSWCYLYNLSCCQQYCRFCHS